MLADIAVASCPLGGHWGASHMSLTTTVDLGGGGERGGGQCAT